MSFRASCLLFAAFAAGCTGDTSTRSDAGVSDFASGTSDSAATASDNASYAFASRFGDGDSVSYTGQAMRQVLIADFKTAIGGLTDQVLTTTPEPGDIASQLNFYFEFDSSTSGGVAPLVHTDPAPLQVTYDDISSDKNLVGKLAGNDGSTDHKDWSTAFAGVGTTGSTTPEQLVSGWIAELDALAVQWGSGNPTQDPSGANTPGVHVTADGRDLQQLIEKFLRAGVAFSQGADDYLDDDVEGKGLLSDHSSASEDKPYTALEHAWDEGFGYFGAARTYATWTDDMIAGGHFDANGDSAIDLTSEVSWGHASNAGKRDAGSAPEAMTDFTQQAWDGFYNGRKLLSETTRALTEEELNALREHRNQALEGWEKAIAATVVHYINETLIDMGAIGTDDYSFGSHAKHWGELKGFALSFQFNPHSPLSDADFEALHERIGDAPTLENAGDTAIANAMVDLVAARDILATAFDFDAANLGDSDGLNGW